MGVSVEWWRHLSDFWKGALVVFGAFVGGMATASFAFQQMALPARVAAVEAATNRLADRAFQHDTALDIRGGVLDRLVIIANDNAEAVRGLRSAVNRIVCLQEADQGIRPLRECALLEGVTR
jgi:hypothetical protein